MKFDKKFYTDLFLPIKKGYERVYLNYNRN